jgi:hypothetical protein
VIAASSIEYINKCFMNNVHLHSVLGGGLPRWQPLSGV